MKEKITGQNVKQTIMGMEILAILTHGDSIEIAIENGLWLKMFHNSFWRVLKNGDIIASSKDLFATYGYGDATEVDHFPPMVQEKIEEMEEYDEEVASDYLHEHIDELISALKDALEGKTISDVLVSPYGDIDILASDNVRIQVYSSFPNSVSEEAYRLEKG